MKLFLSANTEQQFDACCNAIKADNGKFVDGIEVYTNLRNDEYNKKLRNYDEKMISIHMPEIGLVDGASFQNLIYIANDKDYVVNATFHPVSDAECCMHNKHKTYEFMRDNIIYPSNDNVRLLLENLNNITHKRLGLYHVCDLVHGVPQWFLCWDIGHHIMRKDNPSDSEEYIKKYAHNVHIHDFYGKTDDHYPFNFGNVEPIWWLSYLRDMGYNGNVVFEFAFDYIDGKTIEEKARNYLTIVDYYHSILEGL